MSGERDLVAYCDIEVHSVDVDSRTVNYVMSDDSVDSYGEVVEQKWRLDRFLASPVVLYAHNRSTASTRETLPIGRVVKGPKVRGNKQSGYRLEGTVEFAPREINEFADDVFKLVASGFMKAGSVGFFPHDVRREIRDDIELYVLSDNELFEFSVCPVGANANAIANSMTSRTERRLALAELAEWSTAYINSLPDAAFALIKPGGSKDDDGKTTPRSLRMLPHHNKSVQSSTEHTSVDLPHLRAALSRLPQADMTDAQRSKAEAHLRKHADALLGDGEKSQPAASGQENEMNETEFKARLAELEAQLESARSDQRTALEQAQSSEKQAQSSEKQATESAERIATLTSERDATRTELAAAQELLVELRAERDQLESEAIEAELGALVGTKFHASELPDMREDRKRLGKAGFAERMKRRANLSTSALKIPTDTTPSTLPAPLSGDVPGTKISEALRQAK